MMTFTVPVEGDSENNTADYGKVITFFLQVFVLNS